MNSGLPLIPRVLEKLLQRYAERRQPLTSHKAKINKTNLYILPTRQGVLFFIVLLLILAGAINYQNSLGFMLVFLTGSICFLAMVYTHQNLNHLSLYIGNAQSVFAEQTVYFPITLKFPEAALHPAIQIQAESNETTITHLISKSETQDKIAVQTIHRGYITLPRIKVSTEFPLGLFHAWSWLQMSGQCLVYPKPASRHYVLEQPINQQAGDKASEKAGVDDFAGIRQYQAGDAPAHMAWKAIAKTGELQTKRYTSETDHELCIDWSHLDARLGTEEKLSILCRMVLDAEDKGISYSFSIPGLDINSSFGLQHKQRCLKALALFGIPRETQ